MQILANNEKIRQTKYVLSNQDYLNGGHFGLFQQHMTKLL